MSTHGGKRPGAGRKTAAVEAEQADSIGAFNQARARKETALADIREIEARKLRGELLDVNEVAEASEKILSIARSHLLALPSRMAPEVAGESDMRKIEATIREHIHTMLDDLATRLRSLGTKEVVN